MTLVRHTVKKAQDPLGKLIMPLSCLLFKLHLFSPLLHSPGKSVLPQLLPLEATETVLLSHFPNKGSVVPFSGYKTLTFARMQINKLLRWSLFRNV